MKPRTTSMMVAVSLVLCADPVAAAPSRILRGPSAVAPAASAAGSGEASAVIIPVRRGFTARKVVPVVPEGLRRSRPALFLDRATLAKTVGTVGVGTAKGVTVRSTSVSPARPVGIGLYLHYNEPVRVHPRSEHHATGFALIPNHFGGHNGQCRVMLEFQPWGKGRYVLDLAASFDGTLVVAAMGQERTFSASTANACVVLDVTDEGPLWVEVWGRGLADAGGQLQGNTAWGFYGCQVTRLD